VKRQRVATAATPRKDKHTRASNVGTPTNAQLHRTSAPGALTAARHSDPVRTPARGFAFDAPVLGNSAQNWEKENDHPFSFSGGPTLHSHSADLVSSSGTKCCRLAKCATL